jgi:hypothetical protein
MAVAEYTWSELVRDGPRVASAVEKHGRVILHRRNAPDLALSRAEKLSELDGFARLLAEMLKHLPAADVVDVVTSAQPWTRYLTDTGVAEFAAAIPAVVRDCVDLGTLAPLETFLSEWRDTAAIQADPSLADALTEPIEYPLGTRVATP